MIFQHTHAKVLAGTKTQTRRLVKAGDWGFMLTSDVYGVVYNANNKKRWQAEKTYAVQPARGQKAIARIKLLGIRRQDVRLISLEDAIAEGFYDDGEFLRLWMEMHDPKLVRMWWDDLQYKTQVDRDEAFKTRPKHLYDAWVLDFTLV